MVTTRSRSQGSPQVRDLDEVTNSRKRLHSEQASPIEVKKRSKKSEAESRSSTKGSRPSKPESGTGEGSLLPTDDLSEGAGKLDGANLALRQRSPSTDSSVLNVASSTPEANAQLSRHVRFESEEGLELEANLTEERPNLPQEVVTESVLTNGLLESDEDDAPEAISTAKSHAQARTFAEEAAKAIRSKNKVEKDLRKQRDSKLKRQAQESLSRRHHDGTNEYHSKEMQDATSQLARQLLKEERMPDFLPAEILNAKPDLLAQNDEQSEKPSSSLSRKIQGGASIPSKEIVRQGRVVKILDSANSFNPPVAMASTKIVRETWLEGKRKNDDSVAARRRPFSNGFIRR